MWDFCKCKQDTWSYPGDSRSRYLLPGFPDYWFAPGTWSHLHVPWVTGWRGNVFVMALPRVTLLNVRELREWVCRTLNPASGTLGRAGGSEKHTTPLPHPKKKSFVRKAILNWKFLNFFNFFPEYSILDVPLDSVTNGFQINGLSGPAKCGIIHAQHRKTISQSTKIISVIKSVLPLSVSW